VTGAELGETTLTRINEWVENIESASQADGEISLSEFLEYMIYILIDADDFNVRKTKQADGAEQDLQLAGGTSPQKASGTIVCSVCGEPATLICGECDDKLYCDGCSAFVHSKASKKSHTSCSLSKGANRDLLNDFITSEQPLKSLELADLLKEIGQSKYDTMALLSG
jgi:hypothetical protein